MKIILRALVLLAALVMAHAFAANVITVKQVSVQLFLVPSGEFSKDVLTIPDFGSWNFRPAIPMGQADEQFHSYLIKVRLSAGKEIFAENTVAEIQVVSQRTKRVLWKEKIANLYFPPTGETVVARLVTGHECEPVIIRVIVSKKRIDKKLQFECGE